MPVKPNALLDDLGRDGIGQIKGMVRYYVQTNLRENIGRLNVLNESAIEASGGKRTIGDLTVAKADLDAINVLTDRIAPTWVLEDGSEHQCGVFYFTDRTLTRDQGAPFYTCSLQDGTSLFEWELDHTFSIGPGQNIGEKVRQLCDMAGILFRDVPDTGAAAGPDIGVWPDTEQRAKPLAELARMAGWLPPFFDNSGGLVCRPPVALTDAIPDHIYDLDGHRIIGPPIERDNLLTAPNVHKVINNGPTPAPVYGEAAVDPSRPYSREKLGYTRKRTHEEQAVGSSNAAEALADVYAKTDDETFRTVEFDSVIDPRHDIHQIGFYDGTNWREDSYRLPLAPGMMHHVWTQSGFSDD